MNKIIYGTVGLVCGGIVGAAIYVNGYEGAIAKGGIKEIRSIVVSVITGCGFGCVAGSVISNKIEAIASTNKLHLDVQRWLASGDADNYLSASQITELRVRLEDEHQKHRI